MSDGTKKAPANEGGGSPCEARVVPGYNGKYRITREGVILRGNETVSQWGDPPRVTLYQRGKRYQPYVHVLLRRAGWTG